LSAGFGIPEALTCGAIITPSHQTADIVAASHTAGGIGVNDSTPITVCYEAANARRASHTAGGIRVTYRAIPIISYQTTNRPYCATHISCGIGVGDDAIIVSDPTANIIIAGHGDVHHVDIFDDRFLSGETK